MHQTSRRYDIDWLRVIAIGLLIFYHIGIAFQPWGVFIGFIQNSDSIEALWPLMSWLNVWRIPLLFFVSGMGVCFALGKRDWKQLIAERFRRIMLPFLFGMLVIVPLHVLLWLKYYNQDPGYKIHPGHLWFLANIFIYVVVLSPVFFYMKRKQNSKFMLFLKKLLATPIAFIITAILFMAEVLIVNPSSFSLYAMTWHGFFLGLLAFLMGFLFVFSGDPFWNTVKKWKWIYLIVASSMFFIRYLVFDLSVPDYYEAGESILWIFTIFGFGYTYLNHSSRILSYLSQAAYPVYILHMLFLYIGSYYIFPLELPAYLKFVLVLIVTAAGCFGTYEFVIRRIKILRPLFGLKMKTRA